MASRLLHRVGTLIHCSMASGDGVPTDDGQTTGLEREVMMMLAPKAASVVCNHEDNTATICFWLHKVETQPCPSYGTHDKLVPHQLTH
ncbi:unnamed protein product [Nyctereutes procyonoides]|uniref:(raccoon dog) hypothetical protein n=1 Tax=Nyctereutes procyonoides TaxID=34880 RepID=A0A811Z2W2_NYCPR|nr:unnamed protein product [Nyctereutes procyonoides]